jgi:hypothetical protein
LICEGKRKIVVKDHKESLPMIMVRKNSITILPSMNIRIFWDVYIVGSVVRWMEGSSLVYWGVDGLVYFTREPALIIGLLILMTISCELLSDSAALGSRFLSSFTFT